MFLAIVEFETAAIDRAVARTHLDGQRDQIRALPGNLDFRVHAARENETRVTVIHEWDDASSFAGYLGSDLFARSGEVLRPLMTAAPTSRRFHAELLATVA
ncbi:hypothetical protein UG55_10884 [Frankia sp. EI5c]|uniref:putative quinol monooxygenase n=1 Tax=Frankia sp. EI5c TaxID=683316 RepID=UPI0007C24A67|nr:antibiotic biosynthesis monooxygenase [Frankia sp. EI5c]OAA19600.1 hypothetical protein UG55_10884 [Frankia sp. EI5c]